MQLVRRVYSTQIVGDGNWHHITGTNDGVYSRLYVDGYETGTAKTSAGIATTQDILCIGNWAYVYSSPRYLNGNVRVLRFIIEHYQQLKYFKTILLQKGDTNNGT